MTATTMRFDQLRVGTPITPLVKRPTAAQLFRFSAATWNAHRIHYDADYARTVEGYPDVLVQSHLHGAFLAQAVREWAGPGAQLRRFRWQNRSLAVPGDELTCTGRVTATTTDPGDDAIGIVECALEEHKQDGTLCAPAWATLALPRS
jgi:acyl dehydratase